MSKTKLRRYILPYKKEILWTLFATWISVATNLCLPFFIRQIIDGLAEKTLNTTSLSYHVSAFAGLGIVAIFFSRILRKIPLKLSHKVEYDLRKELFAHLLLLDQSFFQTTRTGDLMTRMSSDLQLVRDAIGQGLLQGIRTLTVLLFSAIVMFLIDPQMASLVFALYLPMILIFFLIIRVMRRHQKSLQEHVSEVANFSQESFAGIRTLKGFALENRRNKQFKNLNTGLIKKNMLLQASRQSLWPFMALWSSLGMLLILNIGGRRIIHNEITLGTLTQFIQYLLYMQWPLLALSWTSSLIQRGRVSWKRICEILEQEPAIQSPTPPLSPPVPPSLSTINFKNISLEINQTPLLTDINLHLPAGTFLGITGPTGSGKTLLVSLVARLIDPTTGTLLIDGQDAKTYPLESLRKRIGFAAQEATLFSRTLAHNIGFGLTNPSSKQIRWAAEMAHFHSEIETFPKKYQTILGERGVTLSGGQRQRTAISRAIARNPAILVLDDVLSAVDTHTEAKIMKNLQPIIKNQTTLFVSHRISTLRYADEIIVIEAGRITQRGTHQQLLAQPGYYSEINTLQQLEHEDDTRIETEK